MSNINNQTNNLYTIDTVQDLSQESAAAIQGDSNFRGVSATLRPGRYANIGLGIIPNDSISSFRRVG
jgi:hypothetical protein